MSDFQLHSEKEYKSKLSSLNPKISNSVIFFWTSLRYTHIINIIVGDLISLHKIYISPRILDILSKTKKKKTLFQLQKNKKKKTLDKMKSN